MNHSDKTIISNGWIYSSKIHVATARHMPIVVVSPMVSNKPSDGDITYDVPLICGQIGKYEQQILLNYEGI